MNRFPTSKALLLSLLLSISLNVAAQQEKAAADGNGEPPRIVLRVLDVLAGSPAASAGLETMDVITKYGDVTIVDAASYFVARDAHQRSPNAKVEIVYWRRRERMTAIIPPGRMGIRFN